MSLTANSTEVFVMPDGALYWWGYKNNLQDVNSANGWTPITSWSFAGTPTYNTNDIFLTRSGSYSQMGVGNASAMPSHTKICLISKTSVASSNEMWLSVASGKTTSSWSLTLSNTTMAYNSLANNSDYCSVNVRDYDANSGYVYALWYE